jgi:hypothetical protein
MLLNDHVFDRYFDGQVRPEDTHAVDYRFQPIDELVNYVEKERHLPSIDGREAWQKDGLFSLDKVGTQIWTTVEEQALYIKELNERTRILEAHLLQQRLRQLHP